MNAIKRFFVWFKGQSYVWVDPYWRKMLGIVLVMLAVIAVAMTATLFIVKTESEMGIFYIIYGALVGYCLGGLGMLVTLNDREIKKLNK